jgi:hypothetical protein
MERPGESHHHQIIAESRRARVQFLARGSTIPHGSRFVGFWLVLLRACLFHPCGWQFAWRNMSDSCQIVAGKFNSKPSQVFTVCKRWPRSDKPCRSEYRSHRAVCQVASSQRRQPRFVWLSIGLLASSLLLHRFHHRTSASQILCEVVRAERQERPAWRYGAVALTHTGQLAPAWRASVASLHLSVRSRIRKQWPSAKARQGGGMGLSCTDEIATCLEGQARVSLPPVKQ